VKPQRGRPRISLGEYFGDDFGYCGRASIPASCQTLQAEVDRNTQRCGLKRAGISRVASPVETFIAAIACHRPNCAVTANDAAWIRSIAGASS
jgi:hypothetical protein